MSFFTLLLIAVGLSMDAFAVAVSNGMCHKLGLKKALVIGLYFGVFQAVMPLIGWAFAINFKAFITNVDHWIAFALLFFIGGKMLYEAIKENGDACEVGETAAGRSLTHRVLLIMAVATSIDALAVGISFAALDINIFTSALTIGVVTFAISTIGALIGRKFGNLLGKRAEIFGGLVLIGIGVKILLEHLMGKG